MKTQGWKRYKAREPVSPEVRKARVWIALAIGAGCGWAMAAGTGSIVVGVITGLMFFVFLMIRRGRIERL